VHPKILKTFGACGFWNRVIPVDPRGSDMERRFVSSFDGVVFLQTSTHIIFSISVHFITRVFAVSRHFYRQFGMDFGGFIEILSLLFWLSAPLVYALKLFSPLFDALTSYGKQQDTFSQSIVYNKRSWSQFTLENKLAWRLFYCVGMASPIAFLFVDVAQLSFKLHPGHVALALMIAFQTGRRLFESFFVSSYSPRRMHVVALLSGLAYYLFLPTAFIMPSQQFAVFEISPNQYFLIMIGTFLFVWSSYEQNKVHRDLAQLRIRHIQSHQSESGTKYFLPSGGWFRQVYSPHYMFEIVIYASLMVISFTIFGWNVRPFLVVSFVTMNLTHAAIRTRQWYLMKFRENVRSNVHAIIPHML
jgi:hypothetical protein